MMQQQSEEKSVAQGKHLCRLLDGTEVPSDSEAWRAECEARAIAALPSLAERRAWLEDIGHKRGADAVQALRRTMAALWDARAREKVAAQWGPPGTEFRAAGSRG